MADFDPDAYLAKPFDPDAYLSAGKKPAASAQPPVMELSTDASGRRVAAPTTNYNLPEKQRGIVERAREGAAAPMEDPGFSQENRNRFPWLNHLQPAARELDIAAKTPASIWGGISGAAAGLGEKVMGPAWADRLQRDLGVLPAAIAPEVPMGAAETSALRAPKAELRPPPVPGRQPPPLPPEVSAIPRQVDRPGANVGLLNTNVEHELPAAQSRALSAAGNGGPLSGMHPDTIAFLRRKMEEQGFNQNTIDQRLGEMSAHHFFGEITPSLEGDMAGIAGHAGPGRLEIMGSQRQRAIEGPERAGHSLTRAFGENENIPQMQRIMDIEKKREADPLYAQFRNTQITPTPQIDALIPRLEAAGVLQGANRALRIEGQPASRGFPIPGEPPTVAHVPTAGAFQLALEQISDKVGAAMREGNRNEARRYTGLRNDLLDALDSHPNVGNTWRQARTAYARPQAIQDAIEMGRRVTSNAISADELPFITSHYSEPEMRGLRVGLHDSLRQKLGKRDMLTADLHNTILSPNNEAKFRWVIGDQATDALLNDFSHERHMHGAPARTTGQSPTATRSQAMKEWGSPDEGAGITLGDVGHAIKSPGRTAAGAALGAAEKFGLSHRRAAAEAKWARIREEASRIMTLQGPERDAVARYLVGDPYAGPNLGPLQGHARGGKVSAEDRRASALRVIRRRVGGRVGYAEGGAPWGDVGGAMPEAFVTPRHGIGAIADSAITGLTSLPRRAIENSQRSLDTGDYDPATSMEAALLTVGAGAGARGGLRPRSPVEYAPTHERPVQIQAAAPGEAAGDVGGGLAGSPGGGEGLREAQLQASRRAGSRQPLEGLPTQEQIVDGKLFTPGPYATAHDVAEGYMAGKDFGLPHPDRYHPLDVEHARNIAQAFEDMPHAPKDPQVKAAYEALAKETLDQYRAIKGSGLKITPVNAADYPYHGNPRAVAQDVADNNHMAFFKTDEGFGTNAHADPDHPLLRSSGEKVGDHDMLYNDLFRVVHDYFGHVKNGFGFRAAGEDNAWRAHAPMYSPLARRAMTTETRGQNSWLNHGPHGDFNRTANAADTIYSDQKVGLMPEWTMQDRPTRAAGGRIGYDEGGDVTTDDLMHRAYDQLGTQPERLAQQKPAFDVGEPMVGDGGQFSPGTAWGNKAADIGSKLVTGAAHSLATLPRRAIENSQYSLDTGNYDPSTSAEAVLNIAGARLPWAKSGAMGVFGGKLAKTADHAALAKAEEMHAAGASREDIWKETGWFQGADKQWRFEIPDTGADFARVRTKYTIDNFPHDVEKDHILGQAFEHPDLYKAYPDLAERPLQVKPVEGYQGAYFPDRDSFLLAQRNNRYGEELKKDAREVMLHEMQHGIQKREGFARGANSEMPEVFQAARQEWEAARIAAEKKFQLLVSQRQNWLDRFAEQNSLDLELGSHYQRAAAAYKEAHPELEVARDKAYHLMSAYMMPSEFRHNAYKRFAGETEARNVQTRSGFNRDELGEIAPWETQDIPAAEQIVAYHNAPAQHRTAVKPPPKQFYEGDPVINAGVDARPNPRVQTVSDPHRMMFPGIYKNPRVIAEEAAAQVGAEDPAMKQLFGVTRGDLYEMNQGRVGNEAPKLSLAANPRGSLAAQNIQTPQNTQRMIDVMTEAAKHDGLRMADAWYVMDPMYWRLKEMFGPEQAAIRYRHLNTTTGMASPGSEVMTEIQRGTGAHWLQEQGRFADFKKYAGLDNELRNAMRMPKDMRYIQGHPYHRTSQVEPMEKYFQTGAIQSESPKVPLYTHASGVPETGFQTTGPVGDAHFSRATGLADTRKGPTDVGSSFSRAEYQALQPWWQHDVAAPLGLESVPAQARTWTTFGPQTGVESELGAPKLELFAKQIMRAAKRLGVSPEKARDLILSGKAGAGKRGGAVGPNFAEGGAAGDDYNTPVPNEAAFQAWKAQTSPNDSGRDYDLRGAYLANLVRDATNHLNDRFKKPNHPTFSDQSQYAVGDQRARAGSWAGDTFVPPSPYARGGRAKRNPYAP